MTQYTIKQINTSDAVEGMVLGEDIIYSNGLLLFPKDTSLTQRHIIKLSLYDINHIYIKDFIHNKIYTKSPDRKLTPGQIKTEQNFIKFSRDYEVQQEKVKDNLNQISDGKRVKIADLFSLSSNLVQELGCQGNLFRHLCHLETSDDSTFTHSLNVSMLCNIFGKWLHLDDHEIESLTVAGLLHDIGKIKVDPDILNKPDKLTKEEFDIIKQHPKLGYDMVKDSDMDEGIKQAILLHHEKMNGSGYPLGLSWDKIHPYAKIVAIVDIYDAMTSERTYHPKYSPFKVIKIFEEECYGILDTHYMYIFLEHIAHNYIGSIARLSTGEECEIKFIHKSSPSRPIVQVDNVLLDLRQETNIFIEEIL